MKKVRTSRRGLFVSGALLLTTGLMVGPSITPSVASASSTPYANVNLTISVNGFGPQADNLNPFLPTSTDNSAYSNTDMMYEPLWQYNIVNPSQTYPWLATTKSLSNGDKTLTLTLHPNVKWSDGKPFTSADVVYTFDLLKKYSALNTNGITFASVTATGPLGVKFTFSRPSFAEVYYILNQTPIVPQHIWSKVKNPVTYTDTNPIGTGPFVLKSFTPQYMVLKRNPHYWQPGLPKVNTITYPSVGSAAAQNAATNAGQYDWSSLTEPNLQKLFVDKSPHNHYWYPPVGVTALLPNLTVYPLNLAPVRQAISMAINRKTVGTLGEWGYEQPVKTATGLILPNYKSALDPKYANSNYSFNVAKAKSLLKSAGLKTNSNGQVLGKNGQPLSLSLIDPSGYSDYMQDLTIISNNLKAIGIGTTVQGLSVGTWTSDLATGEFDLSLYYSTSGPTPYYIYNAWLNSTLSAKVGSSAAGDFQRWSDPSTQKYLTAYANAASDAQRQAALSGIEGIMINKLPVIPLVYSIDWGAYTTNNVSGWPTPTNAYSSPGPIEAANQEFVLLHLFPSKKG
jgi:peptide/nickel transport system substrate-binding protein